jgi:hypothetical protein
MMTEHHYPMRAVRARGRRVVEDRDAKESGRRPLRTPPAQLAPPGPCSARGGGPTWGWRCQRVMTTLRAFVSAARAKVS